MRAQLAADHARRPRATGGDSGVARRNGVSPPRERSEEVYAAALRLFREKGYHATSMQDIAAAVGLYKGSLYHYIGGKQDLLVQVFERAMSTLLADAEAWSTCRHSASATRAWWRRSSDVG